MHWPSPERLRRMDAWEFWLALLGCLKPQYGHHSLQILPDFRLRGGIPQQVGRMIGGHQFRIPEIKPFAAQLGDALRGLQQRLRRTTAEGANDFGLDRINLPHQERRADLDLIFLRQTVFWRAALHPDGDIDALTLQAHGLEHIGQQSARAPHKRFAAQIFITPRSFPDEHQLRVWITGAEYNLVSVLRQFAARAIAMILANP